MINIYISKLFDNIVLIIVYIYIYEIFIQQFIQQDYEQLWNKWSDGLKF